MDPLGEESMTQSMWLVFFAGLMLIYVTVILPLILTSFCSGQLRPWITACILVGDGLL